MYSLHCEHRTKQQDTLFSYKLDFKHSKGPEVMGHHRIFRPKKKDVTKTPIEKKISKKGASSNIVNIDEERNLVFGIEDCRSFHSERMCGPTGWVHVFHRCSENRGSRFKLDLNWKFFRKLDYFTGNLDLNATIFITKSLIYYNYYLKNSGLTVGIKKTTKSYFFVKKDQTTIKDKN